MRSTMEAQGPKPSKIGLAHPRRLSRASAIRSTAMLPQVKRMRSLHAFVVGVRCPTSLWSANARLVSCSCTAAHCREVRRFCVNDWGLQSLWASRHRNCTPPASQYSFVFPGLHLHPAIGDAICDGGPVSKRALVYAGRRLFGHYRLITVYLPQRPLLPRPQSAAGCSKCFFFSSSVRHVVTIPH